MSRPTRWLLIIVCLGTFIRLAFLAASQMMIEGDEAAVGLQALHILRGERPIFYPGQAYLGNFESYITAAVFAIGGASRLTLKLVPLIFALVFIYLCFRIGVEIFHDERIGLFAALAAAAPPVYVVMWSVKARGGYIEALVLAQLAWLWINRWAFSSPLSPVGQGDKGDKGERSRTLRGLIAGLISGYAIWMNPITLYVFAPLGIVLTAHALGHWRDWRNGVMPIVAVLLGALIGLLPFILFRIAYGDAAFGVVTNNVPPQSAWRDLVEQVWQYFWRDSIPTLLGLRGPKDKPFALDWRVIVTPIYLVALMWLVRIARASHGAVVLLLMLLVVFPIFAVGALAGGNFAAIIPDSGLLTRYLLPLTIVCALALAVLLTALPTRLRALALVVVLGVNVWTTISADAVALSRNEFANQPLPAINAELIAFLDQANLQHIFTNHWIGYPLMFDTRERILTFDYAAPDLDRFPDASAQVRAARNAALVVFNPHYEPNPIDAKLKQLGISFKKQELADFIVYYAFDRPFDPISLDDVLQWPYN
ncbi:MAG: hypothetical protein ABI874_03515 [Chloroflexota bacterium]